GGAPQPNADAAPQPNAGGPSITVTRGDVGYSTCATAPTSACACERGVLAHINDGVARLVNEEAFRVYGWLDGGYMWNSNNPRSNFHGPYNSVDREELMGNQAYLVLERGLPCDDIGFGGRV